MNFTLLPNTFAIVRMAPSDKTPRWAAGAPLVSVTRTESELSIVCREALIPAGAHADRGWQCLKVEGPMPLTMVGVAAEFSSVLAKAGISVFIVSTFDTDYVLVKGDKAESATKALEAAGHTVRRA